MVQTFADAVFNYLTLITVLVALFVPSFWIAGAAAVCVAMIGVIGLTPGQPDSQIVAAWLSGQVIVAMAARFIGRFSR